MSLPQKAATDQFVIGAAGCFEMSSETFFHVVCGRALQDIVVMKFIPPARKDHPVMADRSLHARRDVTDGESDPLSI
jgi:hypothetical protein